MASRRAVYVQSTETKNIIERTQKRIQFHKYIYIFIALGEYIALIRIITIKSTWHMLAQAATSNAKKWSTVRRCRREQLAAKCG